MLGNLVSGEETAGLEMDAGWEGLFCYSKLTIEQIMLASAAPVRAPSGGHHQDGGDLRYSIDAY